MFVLRSLSDGSSRPIAVRKRLDADTPTRVVLELDGGKEANFDGTTWTTTRPDVYVFDEQFVDENVHSGLSVSASHRQGVHELVLGTQGVQLQRRVEDIAREIADINTIIREKKAELANELAQRNLHDQDIEAFCALEPLDNVDSKIQEAETRISVLLETEAIRAAPHFKPFSLPQIDLDEVRRALTLSLEGLEQTALEAVQAHVSSLGTGSERWLSEGEQLRAGSASCPFCAQGISSSPLVSHYRAYFSEAYDSHLAMITSLRSRLSSVLSGDALASFEREFQSARENGAFWSKFIEIPGLEVGSEAIARVWSVLRDTLDKALALKQARPLETFDLESSATAAYERFSALAEMVHAASELLLDCNTAIDAAKEQAGQGSLYAAQSHLKRLLATKERFTPEVAAICTALKKGMEERADLEKKKQEAREALAGKRERVFGTYQDDLNRFLAMLSAEFSIDALEPSDRGRGGPPSTVYCLKINESRVKLDESRGPGPSFGTVLSSGDRNTLALAFFLRDARTPRP